MIRAGLALAFGALAAWSSPAAAKGGDWQDASSAQARKMASQVTRCMIGAHDAEIRSALDAPFGDSGTIGILGPMISTCFDTILKPKVSTRRNQLRLPTLLLRGLLYEAAYARTFGKSGSANSFAMTPPASYPAVAASATATLAHDYRAVMRIGECAFRNGPAQARDLVLSDVTSKDEERALAAFQPAWTGCLPAGKQVFFSTEMIRGSVAEPLYRLSAQENSRLEAAG